ncbi:MAG TPA: acyl-CoA-binding protein [Candidatus Hydrogenedentes bacterium]|nr:acyl-CoA-binding protein [Candidatus Hydrogenedentota bacterium]HNT86543.1 acyl-CoA-binding protein [Candidatus Hydrogenedentota bacterium]
MSDDLKARFEQASQEVTQLSQAPDNMAKLRLYALYKQASAGDCTGERPGMLNPAGRFKYDAWKALEGTSQDDAMTQYIEFVEELKAADQQA